MILARRRTALAATLIAGLVLVPCTAWYLAGSRSARERAETRRQAPLEQARRDAVQLADQVALRLESLREAESARPFHEYLSDGQQIGGDCDRPSGLPSPLAAGPADPLIWAHFQIDDVGVLSMPTLDAEGHASPVIDSARASLHEAIFQQLECASSEHLSALRRDPPSSGRKVASAAGVVTVGFFSWHTAMLGDEPSLVALREVVTPAAVLTQGFVIPRRQLTTLLSGSDQPASIRPGSPDGPGQATVPIRGDLWTLDIDSTEAEAVAGRDAAAIVRRFHGLFAVGAGLAGLVGLAVFLVVRQSDRLAEQRSRFAAAAAHELRTPLAGLQLYGEMLAEGVGDPERHLDYARRIADEAARLGRVVHNVLGSTQLERGGSWVRPRPGDLAATVRDSLGRLRTTVESRGARLEAVFDESLPACSFDPEAVHQILQNLIDNAEKFSREAADRTIRVEVTAEEGGGRLTVVDAGSGVAPAIRRRLFRPFVRDDSAPGPSGLGLGLAMVDALAREQGGSVEHEIPAGGGSRFSVRFPAAAPC